MKKLSAPLVAFVMFLGVALSSCSFPDCKMPATPRGEAAQYEVESEDSCGREVEWSPASRHWELDD